MMLERLSARRLKNLLYYNRDLRQKLSRSVDALLLRKEIAEIIEAISTNRVLFTDSDKRLSYKLAEKLVREAGYDENGIYSESAKKAVLVLCKKQGILPYRSPLIDKKRSFTQRLKDKFIKIAQKYVFTQDCLENDGSLIVSPSVFFNKGFYNAQIVRLEKQQPKKINSYLEKCKRYAAAVFFITTSFLGLSRDNSIHQDSPQIQTKSPLNANLKKSSLQKILDNKSLYITTIQHKRSDAVYDNYYNFYLNSRLNGEERRLAFYKKIQKQLDNGIFKLENGVTLPRFAYALYLSQHSEKSSVLQAAIDATDTITPELQKKLTFYVLGIGRKGEKLKDQQKHESHIVQTNIIQNLRLHKSRHYLDLHD